MEVKEGYKQTEVGVIPEDWVVKKLGEIAELATGNTPPTNNPTNYGDQFFFVSPVDLGKGKWILETEKKLSKKGFVISRKFPKNSILFTCIGSTIGKSGMAPKELTSNQQINAVLPNSRFSSDYLFYSLNLLSQRIKSLAGEQAVPIINKSEFGETPIPLPNTKAEQITIAVALSDADALIQSLEKLIAKKRRIKKGAMQELLKPKEGWVVKKLGTECELITKGTTPTSIGENFRSSGISFIKIESLGEDGNILMDKIAFIDKKTNNSLKRSQLKVNDVLISIAGALGRVAIVKKDILPANTNQALAIARLKSEARLELAYLFHLLKSNRIQKHIEAISVQGAQANLSLENINDLPIDTPSTKSEQTRIAAILSDMDAEIAALEIKIAKHKQIKRGMMQELLTGRIRLV